MNQSSLKPLSGLRFSTLLLAAICMVLAAGSGNAQRKPGGHLAADEHPTFQEYRGVQLGMSAADVRKKLGAPRDKSAEQDFFVFSDNEMAQVVYDKAEKVIAISADFMSASNTIPSAKDILGTELEAKPDGSMHKLVRFPKAGFWLSYSRTSGADAVVTVQLQKIQ